MGKKRQKLIVKSSPKMMLFGWLILIFAMVSTTFSQDKDVFPVPETYLTEGIPVIKNSEVEHLFYDPASIRSNLIWDVDGKNRRMFVTDATNNVYLVNSPLSNPTLLFDKIFPNSVKTNPNGESIAFMSDHEDEDNYQLYLYDFKENRPKKLVAITGKDESIDSFIWSKTGDSLSYTKVDYESKVSKLCHFNFKVEKCYLSDLKGIWNVLDSNNDKILLKYWKASSSQLLYLYDFKINKLIPIDEKGNSRKAFLAQNRVFWTSEGNENCKNEPCIFSLDLKNNKTTQIKLPSDIYNLQDIKISSEGNNLLIQETRGIAEIRVKIGHSDHQTWRKASYFFTDFAISTDFVCGQ